MNRPTLAVLLPLAAVLGVAAGCGDSPDRCLELRDRLCDTCNTDALVCKWAQTTFKNGAFSTDEFSASNVEDICTSLVEGMYEDTSAYYCQCDGLVSYTCEACGETSYSCTELSQSWKDTVEQASRQPYVPTLGTYCASQMQSYQAGVTVACVEEAPETADDENADDDSDDDDDSGGGDDDSAQ